MVRKSADLGVWLLVLAFMAGLAAYGQPPRDFSADQVVLSEGKVLDAMKLYVSGQKTRSDMNALGGLITIIRRDLRVSWTLMPQSKAYYEKPLTAEELKMPLGAIPNEISRERIGRERVLGYDCTKYRISYGSPQGTQTALAWHADALGMPVRMEMPNVMTSELRNIQIRPQPAALFEIPAGYTKSAAPGFGDRQSPLGTLGARGGTGGGVFPKKQPTIGQTGSGGAAPPVPGKTALKTPVQAFAMEYNVNRNGSDYKDMELKSPDPKVCQAACANDPKCMAWTYVKPGVQGEAAHCWLKDGVPEPTEDENCISGLKVVVAAAGMEYNINRNGSDYKDMELKSPEPKVCQAACANDPKCMAWTYVKPGVQGEAAHCWLKDGVPEPTEDESCISGVKAKKR
jgi:hypothetical protein